MFRNLQGPEIILLILVVVLLFGAKRLPDTARGLGRSLRIFKAETRGLREDDDQPQPAQPAEPPRQIAAQPEAPATPPVAEPTRPVAEQPRTDR